MPKHAPMVRGSNELTKKQTQRLCRAIVEMERQISPHHPLAPYADRVYSMEQSMTPRRFSKE